MFTRVISEALEIDSHRVHIIHGDTGKIANSEPTGGSRTITAAVPACREAARALIEETTALAAKLLQVAPERVSYTAGVFQLDGRRHASNSVLW